MRQTGVALNRSTAAERDRLHEQKKKQSPGKRDSSVNTNQPYDTNSKTYSKCADGFTRRLCLRRAWSKLGLGGRDKRDKMVVEGVRGVCGARLRIRRASQECTHSALPEITRMSD